MVLTFDPTGVDAKAYSKSLVFNLGFDFFYILISEFRVHSRNFKKMLE